MTITGDSGGKVKRVFSKIEGKGPKNERRLEVEMRFVTEHRGCRGLW